jgi:CheY-like chemotaxis protein
MQALASSIISWYTLLWIMNLYHGGCTMEDTRHEQDRVLLIDDDPILIRLLFDALTMLGNYAVTLATDGALGLEELMASPPDCIVVDIRMPHLDGLQFVRALRGDPATADIPVVVQSALVQDREVLAGMLSGADAYLLKPVKIDDLLHAIEQSLALSADQRRQRMEFLAQNADATGK